MKDKDNDIYFGDNDPNMGKDNESSDQNINNVSKDKAPKVSQVIEFPPTLLPAAALLPAQTGFDADGPGYACDVTSWPPGCELQELYKFTNNLSFQFPVQ